MFINYRDIIFRLQALFQRRSFDLRSYGMWPHVLKFGDGVLVSS